MEQSAYNGLQEGDVNFSLARKKWMEQLPYDILAYLEEDAELFLHQSLSTPCISVIESCEGCWFTDMAGKKYLDFHGNSVHQVGYRNHYVIEKLKAQLDILPFSPRRYTNKPAIELARTLVSLLPSSLNRVLFAPGGTSAISMALKLARRITGKTKIVSVDGSFHGASLDAIAVGGEEQFRKYMGELSPETFLLPQPDQYRNGPGSDLQSLEILEEILKRHQDIGAFIAETIRNTDVQLPSPGYWKKLRAICDQYGVLLILDEIPIAFGRTGSFFAFEEYGIEPDILCLGKGLGAGVFPLAAMITRDEYNIAADISLGHFTHEKSPLGCTAAQAMIEYTLNERLLQKTQDSEKLLRQLLEELKEQYPLIGDIRGKGLLWAIELVKNRETKERAVEEAEAVMYACLQDGLSFKVSQGNVLQWCPPLIITDEELKAAVTMLRNALAELTIP